MIGALVSFISIFLGNYDNGILSLCPLDFLLESVAIVKKMSYRKSCLMVKTGIRD